MLEAQSDTYQSQPDKPVDGTGDRGSSIDDRVADDLAKIGSQGTLSVVIAGLDGFRIVNDLLGPDEGDVLLAQFAECMSALSFSDVSASGDKFAVSLPGIGARDAVSLADQVRETAAQRIRTPLGSLRVSAGVAAYPVRHSTRHNLEVAGRFLSRSGPTPQKNCDNGCLDAH